MFTNDYAQPIGRPLPNWTPPPNPPRKPIIGSRCTLEPAGSERHARDLYDAFSTAQDGRYWTYLSYGPFAEYGQFQDWMSATCLGDDPLFFTIIDGRSGRAAGLAGYMRIKPAIGVLEMGHIHFGPALQKTAAATEALYLLLARAFDELGYRRCEWKCDALNAPSRRAAQRLGFTYEGTFRQATHYKGRNRDTAWYAIIDGEWPRLKAGFQAWLDPDNFDEAGQQKRPLAACFPPTNPPNL